MIRLLIAGVMVLMAGNANAGTNENVYKSCKEFADSGFNDTDMNALACTMYFIGVQDAYASVCEIYKHYFETLSEDKKSVFEFFALEGSENINSRIQHYVNKMQQKPESWDHNAAYQVGDSLRKMSPCKLE